MNVCRAAPAVALTALLGMAGMTAVTGCAVGVTADGDGKVHAVASFYPLEYVTARIGGSHVHVIGLTRPGTEPHDLELTPQQTGSLSGADLVVYLRGFQPAVDEAVEQAEPRRVAEAGAYARREPAGRRDKRKDPPAGDPHFWLDPIRLARAAEGIGTQLARADPAHAAVYRANTTRLVRDLNRLDKQFKKGLAGARNRTFLTTHTAFGYLARRYGLRQRGISGLAPGSEPSPARLARLQGTVRREKVTTVFFEPLASRRTADTVARDLHLKTAVLDPVEGVRNPTREDYLSVMRRNLRNLQAALGGS